MSNSRRGFNPNRLSTRRPGHIVQQLLSEDLDQRAFGFTEIKVIGVGGAGGNTINRMIDAEVSGIEFIAVNSDVQALRNSRAKRTVAIGQKLTRGLGTGGNPRLGLQAAEQSVEELVELVKDADMVFVTAGMGGGTGTGAAAYVAQLARQAKALTVGVVTKPFNFEGKRRQEVAAMGLEALKENVDALIVIANERLLQITSATTNLLEAFQTADEILQEGIGGLASLITTPGLINLDFADVKTIMANSGSALMAIGTGSGENRGEAAALSAMQSPLLDGSISGARGILLNVTGGPGMTLADVQTLSEVVGAAVSPDANIIMGSTVHPHLGDEVRLTLIATGFGY